MKSLGTKSFDTARSLRLGGALIAICLAVAMASPAQTFTPLVTFDGTDGSNPWAALVQGRDGNYYGTTSGGGVKSAGTVFKITAMGTLTMLYSFCSLQGCADGAWPQAGLVLATDGNFYGTTLGGGTYGYGAVFKIAPSGTLTTLYSFCSRANCADGGVPGAGLVQGSDGNFYGTTDGPNNTGTVFKITAAGRLTTLYSFCSQASCADGQSPIAGLIQANDGNFYGTTGYGGANNFGTLFKITSAGKLTTLYDFCAQANCADGGSPFAGLVQASDGSFYGTTAGGGANKSGTVFKISPAGDLTTLYSFCSQPYFCPDGAFPWAGLVQATDGDFYGATRMGGTYMNWGTVFDVTPSGMLSTLYSFSGGADGAQPFAGLVQATDGNFYGTAEEGGNLTCNLPNGCGTVFRLGMGLSPFASFVRNSGRVGATVQILGQGFTGSTSVLFSGTSTSAVFKVKSDTYLVATVPDGATSGFVTVTTPGGALNSNVGFRVIPRITSFSPTSGPVGAQVTITGVSFTQAIEVTFGGVKASFFTATDDKHVTATVPNGAKTGKIRIMTAGGTATGSGRFTVTQ